MPRIVRRSRETLAFFLLLIIGLAPRLAFVSSFPTIPVSDAEGLVSFGAFLRDHGLTSPVWFWEQFNPGLPLLLAVLFRIFAHADPGSVARVATAVVCGFLPVVPFGIWRGVFPLWVRITAGVALGLWPGQVAFSGVVLQDNWVILPSVALAALAVRSLVAKEPPRVATAAIAGLLYAAGTAVRQEMLVVLLPLFLAAIGADFRMPWRRLAAAALAAGLPLLALAAYRDAATGRFALTTPHGGVTTLGSYIPGAGADGWTHPAAYIASVRPELLRDRSAYFSQSGRLALQEALRRPMLHAERIAAVTGSAAVAGEATILPASLGAEVLPPALHSRGAAMANALDAPLRWETAILMALFVAAVLVGALCGAGVRRPILLLAAAVLIKYAFHAVTVVFGRFFFVSTAWEILAIALAAYAIRTMAPQDRRRALTCALLTGAAVVFVLLLSAPRLAAVVRTHDIDPQRTYRFQLVSPDRAATLDCVVDRGLLQGLDWNRYALLRTRLVNPLPGDEAVARCELTASAGSGPVVLQILDSYAPGGLPGRMVQTVAVDGVVVWSHDLAQTAWSGWVHIPLGNGGAGKSLRVEVSVRALRPEPDMGWGLAGQTRFQLAASSADLNLAAGKSAVQSSDYSATSGAGLAVDGNTDGRFMQGSVTSTLADANAWWDVDLGGSAPIGGITIWNRTDCCAERLSDFWVFVSDTPFARTDTPATLKGRPATWNHQETSVPQPSVRLTPTVSGRYVRVQLSGAGYLSLAEVQVFKEDRSQRKTIQAVQ